MKKERNPRQVDDDTMFGGCVIIAIIMGVIMFLIHLIGGIIRGDEYPVQDALKEVIKGTDDSDDSEFNYPFARPDKY